jgi:hypothetical protein
MTLFAFFPMRFDVIRICNPLNILFPLGRLCRLLGCRFVFDMHDLCPEHWQVRFGKWPLPHALLLKAERASHRTADHMLVTIEAAHRRARDRGGI